MEIKHGSNNSKREKSGERERKVSSPKSSRTWWSLLAAVCSYNAADLRGRWRQTPLQRASQMGEMRFPFQWSALEMAAMLPAIEREWGVTASRCQAPASSLPPHPGLSDGAICSGIPPPSHAGLLALLLTSPLHLSHSPAFTSCTEYPSAAPRHRPPLDDTTQDILSTIFSALAFPFKLLVPPKNLKNSQAIYQECLCTSKI